MCIQVTCYDRAPTVHAEKIHSLVTAHYLNPQTYKSSEKQLMVGFLKAGCCLKLYKYIHHGSIITLTLIYESYDQPLLQWVAMKFAKVSVDRGDTACKHKTKIIAAVSTCRTSSRLQREVLTDSSTGPSCPQVSAYASVWDYKSGNTGRHLLSSSHSLCVCVCVICGNRICNKKLVPTMYQSENIITISLR